jgi:hypothetical protein
MNTYVKIGATLGTIVGISGYGFFRGRSHLFREKCSPLEISAQFLSFTSLFLGPPIGVIVGAGVFTVKNLPPSGKIIVGSVTMCVAMYHIGKN